MRSEFFELDIRSLNHFRERIAEKVRIFAVIESEAGGERDGRAPMGWLFPGWGERAVKQGALLAKIGDSDAEL